jgi:PAS domain S-box-containing protein
LGISATLFMLEYLDYRQTRAAVGDQGERSLLTAELQRLDSLASDLASATAPSLENALRARDEETVSRIAAALLENHATVAVRVLRPNGSLIFETRRSNAWASTLTTEEQRTVRRELGDAQPLGTLELTVARPGLHSSATALRTQLQSVEQHGFGRKVWIIVGAGALITAMLALVAWMLAQRLERPIVELIRSAERIGEGDYTRPHQVTSNDEIADLEVALDRMRQKLQQTTITTNYLTTVLNSMNDAVLVTAPNGIVKRINNAAVRLFGYSEEDLAGRPFTMLLAENERAAFSMEAAALETRETCDRHAHRPDDSSVAVRRAHRRRGSAVPGHDLRRAQHHGPQTRRAPHPLPGALRRADQGAEPDAVPAHAAAGDCAGTPQRSRHRAVVSGHGSLQGDQRHVRSRRR